MGEGRWVLAGPRWTGREAPQVMESHRHLPRVHPFFPCQMRSVSFSNHESFYRFFKN